MKTGNQSVAAFKAALFAVILPAFLAAAPAFALTQAEIAT